MEKSNSESNFWPYLAATAVVVVIIAAIRWSLAHPYGIHWDEGSYLNEVRIDLERLQIARLMSLVRGLWTESNFRPPAYRFLALPFLAPFGYHTTLARFSSMACFGLSAIFIYLTVRRIGNRIAAAFAVLVFALSPEVIAASIFFSTEGPMFLATSAMLYFIFVYWTEEVPQSRTWIGLGLAIGLGLLSKTSFVVIAFLPLAFVLIESFRKHRGLRGLAPIIKAGVLSFVIAAPWWFVHFRDAMWYAKFARSTTRNSLGPHSLAMFAAWIWTVFLALIGPCIGTLIILLALAWIQKALIAKSFTPDPLRRSVIILCICAGVPIIIVQLTSTNHLLRYLTPAVIPLAIAVGILVGSIGWATSKTIQAAACILFFTQLGMIVYPVVMPNNQIADMGLVNGALPWRVMSRFDQWDWKPLRELSNTCGLDAPKISFLGATRPFYPPEITYIWVAAATSSRERNLVLPPEPVWLWREEDGQIDWQKAMNQATQSDIVLTAPGLIGEPRYQEDVDNEHNQEFADRLSRDADFQKPIRLEMGRFTPVEVLVFVKSSIGCRAGNSAQSIRR
jgi:4-amino-4-deoxy-L-arabinose transferase-like glycosyltransferase